MLHRYSTDCKFSDKDLVNKERKKERREIDKDGERGSREHVTSTFREIPLHFLWRSSIVPGFSTTFSGSCNTPGDGSLIPESDIAFWSGAINGSGGSGEAASTLPIIRFRPICHVLTIDLCPVPWSDMPFLAVLEAWIFICVITTGKRLALWVMRVGVFHRWLPFCRGRERWYHERTRRRTGVPTCGKDLGCYCTNWNRKKNKVGQNNFRLFWI